jgi:hypothetical protein
VISPEPFFKLYSLKRELETALRRRTECLIMSTEEKEPLHSRKADELWILIS